jgi:hypothetical protein
LLSICTIVHLDGDPRPLGCFTDLLCAIKETGGRLFQENRYTPFQDVRRHRGMVLCPEADDDRIE